MKLIAVCCLLAVSHCILAQQKDCVQEKEKVLKCKKDVLQGADWKKVQELSRKNIEKCLGKDSVSKCLVKSEECHDKADSVGNSSPLKQQADSSVSKCLANNQQGPGQGMPLVQQGHGMQGQGMQGPGGMQGPPPPYNELLPMECIVPPDPKLSECIDTEESKMDDALVKSLDNKLKDCHKSLSNECVPRNPSVGMCLNQAYAPLVNLTISTYRQCMKEAGYNFANGPQIPNFPNAPQMSG